MIDHQNSSRLGVTCKCAKQSLFWKIQFSFCKFGVIRNVSDCRFKITTSLSSVITEICYTVYQGLFWPKLDPVEETGARRFLGSHSFCAHALFRAPRFLMPCPFWSERFLGPRECWLDYKKARAPDDARGPESVGTAAYAAFAIWLIRPWWKSDKYCALNCSKF